MQPPLGHSLTSVAGSRVGRHTLDQESELKERGTERGCSLWNAAVSVHKAQDVSFRYLRATVHLARSAALRFDHGSACLLRQLLRPAAPYTSGTAVHAASY